MKVKDIRLGESYAIRMVIPSAAHMARTAPVIHANMLDIAGNTVVCEYDAMNGGLGEGPALDRLRAQRQRLFPALDYKPRLTRIRVRHNDVLCLSDEFAHRVPDGRMDAPTTTHAAGHTFEQNRMAHS